MQELSNRFRLTGSLFIYLLVVLGGCLWPFNFFQGNRVSWEPGGGLRFASPGIAYTQTDVSGLAGLSSLTVLMHFLPESPGESSWILSCGLDFERANFLVGLNWNQLVIEVNEGGRRVRAGLRGVLERGKPVWLAMVVDTTGVTVYLDGTKKKHVGAALVSASSWQAGYPLVLGCRSDGKFPWDGVLYKVAVLDRPFEEAELRDPASLIAGGKPVVYYDFTKGSGSLIPNGGEGKVGPLVVPKSFVPLRRAVLMDLAEIWVPMPLWGDIVLNILAFIPIGLLVGAILRGRLGVGSVILVALGVCFTLSLGIEVLQSYLPGRWSTFTDVAANTAGGVLGVALWLSGLAARMLARFAVLEGLGGSNPPATE